MSQSVSAKPVATPAPRTSSGAANPTQLLQHGAAEPPNTRKEDQPEVSPPRIPLIPRFPWSSGRSQTISTAKGSKYRGINFISAASPNSSPASHSAPHHF